MTTSLLSEGGRQGASVVGATGVNIRTGEFYVFKSKATVLAMPLPGRLWMFSTELYGSACTFHDPNCTGEGLAMGWNAGAEFTLLEGSLEWYTPFSYIPYGVGNSDNTWHGCSIVDANGKEVPWVDRDNKELTSVDQRFQPAQGQKFVLPSGLVDSEYEHNYSHIINDLSERIRNGEFVLPLYADLTRLSGLERRAIFGLMVGNEGKTRIPVYDTYTKAGFDPDKDMLQVPVMPPDYYRNMCFWGGMQVPHFREMEMCHGGLVVDWDMRTNLEGLYGASNGIFGLGEHSTAATSGRYAGRKAAVYARTATEPVLDRKQVEEERIRVYLPLKQGAGNIGWKELNA
jgi:succinate dehydrogenase/fumarate reductase flavoprotein subunit